MPMDEWGFDGSSTEQAQGDSSDCVLRPVFQCPDPIRGGKNVLVMCDVLMAKDGSPHPSNTRAPLAAAHTLFLHDALPIIGRASCRERV